MAFIDNIMEASLDRIKRRREISIKRNKRMQDETMALSDLSAKMRSRSVEKIFNKKSSIKASGLVVQSLYYTTKQNSCWKTADVKVSDLFIKL